MKIIYHDKTGRHLPIVIASLHLKLINQNTTRWNIRQLPNFLHKKPPGSLIYMGLDFQGNEIYVLGRKKTFQVIRNAYLGLNRAFSLDQDFIFVDVHPLSNLYLKIFDLLNKNFDKEPTNSDKYLEILFKGIDRALPDLIQLAKEIKKKKLGGNR